MAGQHSDPSFAGRFTEGIHFAMEMGASPDEDEQATFHFPPVLVYDGEARDASGVPFDPTKTVTEQRPDPVRVPCAVEYYDERGQMTTLADIHSTRVKITLLGEDYEKVKGTSFVICGGDKYIYRRTQPPSGLFEVGLYEMWFHAEHET